MEYKMRYAITIRQNCDLGLWGLTIEIKHI